MRKIFIACDSSSVSEIRKIIAKTKTKKLNIGYKFGLEFLYTKNGRKFISKLQNKILFLEITKYQIFPIQVRKQSNHYLI